mmetsp:Transcript_3058/g.4023  ORF Transcript_3058/g.4023 Transcript_3058/m.4023 type:complete len:231 (+) Transcript_3058:355-1047(+)|eukprot:CAMPEP_0201485996 /NCGR_PEP_ID=MMETSP0151_2-20130828/10051_1 /ASSEMBLY_ACC=CAM_ASM_000257 /TAXON_ID=200890 /ORGANISM="Paramoeba atlantica, Strain 621/1 / CCAP 1560/9" /LENGTH=230 /DNA_ID=CAMNT_0047870361 /DNA_START=54 /DNA_END=746 /DNA_ORIENTATION=-
MSSQVPLKIKHNETSYRTTLNELSMAELRAFVAKTFPGLKGYSLYYIDEEGDKITLGSDNYELEEAYEVSSWRSSSGVIVLHLEPIGHYEVKKKSREEEKREFVAKSKKSQEEVFPIPKSLRESVLKLESMGFTNNRERIIELLITNAGNEPETISTLVEERAEAVAKAKVESKQKLVELLNSPFGDSVLENIAELSLSYPEETTLQLFLALATTGNDLTEAKRSLTEEE